MKDATDHWVILTTGPGCGDGVYWRPNGDGYANLLGAGLYTERAAKNQATRKGETTDRAMPLSEALGRDAHPRKPTGPTVLDFLLSNGTTPSERAKEASLAAAHQRLDDNGVLPGPIDVRIGQLLMTRR